ncbi:MAG TPA: RsmG family class I SAM-dependent methyltransferase [Solirubrobacteraceae bacterium]|jgi:16S rRNA (guanine527-N7)-methyltransferase
MSAQSQPWTALLARFGLGARQIERLGAVLAELERDEHAPTAVRDTEEAAKIHVADALVALEVDGLRASRTVADLGSGAGFPGLAIAVALPDAEVRLVESQRRKCQFMLALAAAASVANATVVCKRAEEWDAGIGANDAVLARALAPQPVVLEYAAPLLRLGGTLIDWRGRRNAGDERAAAGAAEQLGLRLAEVHHVEPFAGATDRHLHVFVKECETPDRFPRRAGVARKRPFG